VSRDRSKPWGGAPHDDEPTETGRLDDEATAHHDVDDKVRRAVRSGKRVNLDETNVGGSLLPGGDFGNLFDNAAAFTDEQPTEPPVVAEASPPPSPEPSVELTEPRFEGLPPLLDAAPTRPRRDPSRTDSTDRRPAPEPSGFDEEPLAGEFDDLGPVEEFTISGVMPDELAAMREAAKRAVSEERKGHSPPTGRAPSPPRSRRDDPDPGITGVVGFDDRSPGASPDEEETLAVHRDDPLLRDELAQVRKGPQRGDYNTFGAGLQRLDDLPSVDDAPPSKESTVGGILELLDSDSSGIDLPDEPKGSGGDEAKGRSGRSGRTLERRGSSESAPPEGRERPRRVSTNRAGSRSSGNRPRTPSSPTPQSRAKAANPRTATPRPAPSRSKPPPRSSPPSRSRPRPTPPLPVDTASSASSARAKDEEARIRAALASVSDEEHTSWVQLDEPGSSPAAAASPPPGEPTEPRAAPASADTPGLPGHAPTDLAKPARSEEPSLTMHLEEVGEPTVVRDPPPSASGDETTIRREQRSLGDEETIPAENMSLPPGQEPTQPVPVPSGNPAEDPTADTKGKGPASRGPASQPPTKKPPAKKPPAKKPPTKKPSARKPPGKRGAKGKSKGKSGKPAPVEISALDDSTDSYRDPALLWLMSVFTAMVLGVFLIGFLLLLLYII